MPSPLHLSIIGNRLKKLVHAEREYCRHCNKEAFSIEHYIAKCIIGNLISIFIGEKNIVFNKTIEKET